MTYGQIKWIEQAGTCMLQSSLAIAREIDARGDAKSAKNAFHFNTQNCWREMCSNKFAKNAFRYNMQRCYKNKCVKKCDAKQYNIDVFFILKLKISGGLLLKYIFFVSIS